MQRRNINTVVCVVTIFIILAAVAALVILRNDTSSNSTISDSSSSTGSAILQFNNDTSLLEHNASINYPWTLSGDSSNKTNSTNNDEIISYHDGHLSDFISFTNIARESIVTPIISTRSNSNKCIDSSKSLMRFTLVTDNYSVRFVFNFCAYDMIT